MSAPAAPRSISVIMATRNRCERLALTLDAMTRLEIPDGVTWEMIVVNNGSTDRTDAVLAHFATLLPLRSVPEPVPGIAQARNTGLCVACGEVIAFTDDDCVVDPQWLAVLHAEFARDPELAVVGGRVELFDPRDWQVTIRTSRERASPTTSKRVEELFVGCNMSLSRRALHTIGVFDTAFGAGTRVKSAEDTDLLHRAFRRGLTMVYVPEAVVYHNHGRRTELQVIRLRANYASGRGAIYCKYLLRGDLTIARHAYEEAIWHLRDAAGELRAGRLPRRVLRTWWYLLRGAFAWLTTPRRGARRAERAVAAAFARHSARNESAGAIVNAPWSPPLPDAPSPPGRVGHGIAHGVGHG